MTTLFGYWFRDTDLARKISPTADESDSIYVPQERTTMFRKLPYKVKGVEEHPRRCIFTVEAWLERKPEFQKFREAKFGRDYI